MNYTNKYCDNKSKTSGFTIVELLVVVVVIGILASITIVSYSGIATKARIVSIQSDLANSSKQLKMFYIDNNTYPDTVSTDCAANPTTTTNLCLKVSTGNNFTSTPYYKASADKFGLTATSGGLVYHITEDSAPTLGIFVSPWITIGTQTWATANLNVGTMITGVTGQTNNAVLEKYCFGNLESKCTSYGAFYQWDEAMQYVITAGAQGICPVGAHIPTDNDWKVLEVYLGMTQGQADATGWRGTNQGTQLKVGGVSGLSIPYITGYRFTDGSFVNEGALTALWSSSQSGASAWIRYLHGTQADVNRDLYVKNNGFSVRCIKN